MGKALERKYKFHWNFTMLQLLAKILILPCLSVVVMIIPFYTIIKQISSDDIARLTVPGGVTFTLPKAGEYTVWHLVEGKQSDGGFTTEKAQPPETLTFNVVDAMLETTASLTPYKGATFSSTSETKQSLATFTVARPGDYRLEARQDKTPNRPTVLIVRESLGITNQLGLIVGSLILSSVLMISGIIYAVVAVARHSKTGFPQG